MSENHLPSRLAEIIADFQILEGRDLIELLLDYSKELRPLPDWLASDHNQMNFVKECMTPVYVQMESTPDGLQFHFDVPAELPTVRGFAAIMQQGLASASPEQVLVIPNDFYLTIGLEKVLTMQRLSGMGAILAHVKRLAAEALSK